MIYGIYAFFAVQILAVLFYGAQYMFLPMQSAEGIFDFIIAIIAGLFSFLGSALIMLLTMIMFPFQCFLGMSANAAPDCHFTTRMAFHNYVAYGALIGIPLALLIFRPFQWMYNRWLTADESGVPPVYRLISFFVRDPHAIRGEVARSSSDESAPAFNPSGLSRQVEKKPTGEYGEILELEVIAGAIAEAEQAAKKLSAREEAILKRQTEKIQAAKELAEKMEEVERLKARLSELEKK